LEGLTKYKVVKSKEKDIVHRSDTIVSQKDILRNCSTYTILNLQYMDQVFLVTVYFKSYTITSDQHIVPMVLFPPTCQITLKWTSTSPTNVARPIL